MMKLPSVLRSLFLFRSHRARLPQTLILFVTSRCNCSCDFCLYRHRIEDPVSTTEELTTEELRETASRYGTLHYLALSGGEPFVRNDIEEICQSFVDLCNTSVVDIPSNFWFTEQMSACIQRLVSRNPGVVFDIQLALDNTGEKHDRSRGLEGLYERARRTFARLADFRRDHANLRLKINIVYLERNHDQIRDIMTRVNRDFDYDRIQLTFPHVLLVNSSEETLPDLEDYLRASSYVEEHSRVRRPFDLHSLGVGSAKVYYRKLLSSAIDGTLPVGDYCEAGRNFLVIDETGDVMPCEMLWEVVGNLRESGYDVPSILEGAGYDGFRSEHLGRGECNCTYSCAILGHVALQPGYVSGSVLRGLLSIPGRIRRSRRE